MYRYKMLSILIACLCFLTLSCADSPKSAATKQMPVVVKKQPLKICLYHYHNFSCFPQWGDPNWGGEGLNLL